MSSVIFAATLFGCGRPDPARPVEWKVPAIRYETGKEIIYSGKVGRSKFGGYAIQNLNVLPIAVHLQDTQDSSAFTVGVAPLIVLHYFFPARRAGLGKPAGRCP